MDINEARVILKGSESGQPNEYERVDEAFDVVSRWAVESPNRNSPVGPFLSKVNREVYR